MTTTAAKPSKGQKISWERVWTTKPADSILRPFGFGTCCFVGVAGFKWGPRLRGGVRPILAAGLMAHEPHNYEVGQAIATRKVCNEPGTQAQAASTNSVGMRGRDRGTDVIQSNQRGQ